LNKLDLKKLAKFLAYQESRRS